MIKTYPKPHMIEPGQPLGLMDALRRGYVKCDKCGPTTVEMKRDRTNPDDEFAVCANCKQPTLSTVPPDPSFQEEPLICDHIAVVMGTTCSAEETARMIGKALKDGLPGRNMLVDGFKTSSPAIRDIHRISANHKIIVCDEREDLGRWERALNMKFKQIITIERGMK